MLINSEISPNYIDEKSKTSEELLPVLIDKGGAFGAQVSSVDLPRGEIIESLKSCGGGRLDTVTTGLDKEGLNLDSLAPSVFLDRVLGVDSLFTYGGKKFGVDVTTGKGTVLHNKEMRVKQLEKVYKDLGIDYFVILRLRTEVTDDIVLDFFGTLDRIIEGSGEEHFSHVIKYGVNYPNR